ncbi:hypothetical protein PGT21_023106 [Puccinia graminis f. sp. tritici]|uniref:Uncharacterized protein n=1 Tax=Puccinia graminis f. sp. tritici TaxID=56615 RepID=A0A5B0PL39_PUCGR|nr:hypothetical protein PGT21_023106 [Puccinia graminis f. sp. tritici]
MRPGRISKLILFRYLLRLWTIAIRQSFPIRHPVIDIGSSSSTPRLTGADGTAVADLQDTSSINDTPPNSLWDNLCRPQSRTFVDRFDSHGIRSVLRGIDRDCHFAVLPGAVVGVAYDPEVYKRVAFLQLSAPSLFQSAAVAANLGVFLSSSSCQIDQASNKEFNRAGSRKQTVDLTMSALHLIY